MERKDRFRQCGPPVIRREFARSRHEIDWAAQAYAIAVPVLRKGLGIAVRGAVEQRQEAWGCAVAVGRLA